VTKYKTKRNKMKRNKTRNKNTKRIMGEYRLRLALWLVSYHKRKGYFLYSSFIHSFIPPSLHSSIYPSIETYFQGPLETIQIAVFKKVGNIVAVEHGWEINITDAAFFQRLN
jgi:hypothetical protein